MIKAEHIDFENVEVREGFNFLEGLYYYDKKNKISGLIDIDVVIETIQDGGDFDEVRNVIESVRIDEVLFSGLINEGTEQEQEVELSIYKGGLLQDIERIIEDLNLLD